MPRAVTKLDAEGLYQKAVRALARRGRTVAEIRRLLQPKAAVVADVQDVVKRLQDHGYLDDARLAVSFASFQKDVERHGRGRALRDLRARGVAPAVAEQAVRRGYEGTREDALLRAYVQKKRLRQPEDLRETGKLYRRLLLAGFSSAAIQRCLRAWKLDADWLEAVEQIETGEAGEDIDA